MRERDRDRNRETNRQTDRWDRWETETDIERGRQTINK